MTLACLFAQYHPHGRIPAHTARYLHALLDAGVRLHLACSTATPPPEAELAPLRARGASILVRPNAGLDFGAWQALLHAGAARDATHILLANDSVFGPYADLPALIARMRATMHANALDAWGLVASNERMWHLQSWFVCLSAPALARPALARIFVQPFAAMGKDEIILHGELGLGTAIRAERLRAAAAWPIPRGLRRLHPVNPSHFDWRPMLRTGAVPFLKVELLRDNPANLPSVRHWRQLVASLPHGNPAEIDAALPAGSPPPRQPARLHRRLLNALLERAHPTPPLENPPPTR